MTSRAEEVLPEELNDAPLKEPDRNTEEPQENTADTKQRRILNGQYRNVSYKGNERLENYLPLDSDEITMYYNIFIQVGLTGIESGQEEII